MIQKQLKIFIGSILLALTGGTLADDHNQGYFVETIPMSFIGDSDVNDLLNTREMFKDFMKDAGSSYNVVLMVPWAVDKSGAGPQTDWDVIWAGFSPTVGEYAATLEYYIENGEKIDSVYDSMRSFDSRSMARGKTVFQGAAASPETGVAIFRTCSLNKNKSMVNAESAMQEMGSALKDAGSKGSSHIWMPGAGASQSQQGTFLSVRTFPSIGAWSESFTAYGDGDFSKQERAARSAATCSPMRMYLTYAHYMAAAN